MIFTLLPAAYAPIGAPLYCALGDVTTSMVEVRIILSPGILLGTKRMVGHTNPRFDIAPYLQGCLRFNLASDEATGAQVATDRQLVVHLEAEADGEVISSAPFLLRVACSEEPTSALLTCLPGNRLLAPAESDELTILADAPQPIRLVATGRDGSVTLQEYIIPAQSLWRFRIRAADFPDADTVLFDASPIGVIRYTMLDAPEGSCRLAWRNSRGGVDHYTFPIVERVTTTIEKERACNDIGVRVIRALGEEQIVLRSAYEQEEMMRGLKELLTAEEVWRVGKNGYEAIDVLTDEADIYHHGSLSTLVIKIRSTQKNKSLWN